MKGLFQCPPWVRSFWAFSPYLNHMRNFSKILSSLLCLEDPRQIVVVFAFCHEFTMQPAGFGDGFQ